MKKNFTEPSIEVLKILCDDIVSTSGKPDDNIYSQPSGTTPFE